MEPSLIRRRSETRVNPGRCEAAAVLDFAGPQWLAKQ